MADQTETSEANKDATIVGAADDATVSAEESPGVATVPAVSETPPPASAETPTVAATEAQSPTSAENQASGALVNRPSNIVIGLCLAVLGVVIVAAVTMFTPTPTKDQDLPYMLEPLEKQLDARIRYKRPSSVESKDWRNDLFTEQSVWTNEVSKMILGRPEAKPIEFKRDYLLYLGDSYFKDEPHYAEAKAAYLIANATPRLKHANAYDMGDDELWRRIGYCDTRLGFYDEAETWLKKAEKLNADAAKTSDDASLTGTRSRILDNLAENYARKGQPKKGEELVQLRLREMKQKDIDQCVEPSVLYAMALIKENEGDLKAAEHFYKLGIDVITADEGRRGVTIIPQSTNDCNRGLARLLMSYSHMLRMAHRNDEAIAVMTRALCIYDNPPGQ